MKKITVILLILLVLAITGGVILFAYESVEITYVADFTELSSSPTASAMVAKRLYSSNVDPEKMEELSNTLLTTSFTEDELLEAALKSGKPEFYPWFSFQVTRNTSNNRVILEGKQGQDLFEGQDVSRYRIENLRMEVTSESPIMADESIIYSADGTSNEGRRAVPIVADDGSSLAVVLDRAGAYDLSLEGGSGTVMVQYTYDIATTDALLSRIILKDQLIQFYISVTLGDNSEVSATYEVVDAYQVSDVY